MVLWSVELNQKLMFFCRVHKVIKVLLDHLVHEDPLVSLDPRE